MIFCIAILLEISQKMSLTFLDASMHHYNRVCLSVGWLVNRTVGWLVSWSVGWLLLLLLLTGAYTGRVEPIVGITD